MPESRSKPAGQEPFPAEGCRPSTLPEGFSEHDTIRFLTAHRHSGSHRHAPSLDAFQAPRHLRRNRCHARSGCSQPRADGASGWGPIGCAGPPSPGNRPAVDRAGARCPRAERTMDPGERLHSHLRAERRAGSAGHRHVAAVACPNRGPALQPGRMGGGRLSADGTPAERSDPRSGFANRSGR